MLVTRQKPVIRIMAGLAAALVATPLPAQLAAHSPRADATLASAIAARRIVERGIAALGGQAALDSVSDLVFSLKGFRTDLGQAMAPNLPYTTELVPTGISSSQSRGASSTMSRMTYSVTYPDPPLG